MKVWKKDDVFLRMIIISKGFKFYAKMGDEHYQMGETIKLNKKVNLKVSLPNKSAKIVMIHNGKSLSTVEDAEADFIVQKQDSIELKFILKDMLGFFLIILGLKTNIYYFSRSKLILIQKKRIKR